MSTRNDRRDSLSDYALFYEKIENGKSASATRTRKDEYEKDVCLNEDQVAKLSDDLNAPLSKQNQTNPFQY